MTAPWVFYVFAALGAAGVFCLLPRRDRAARGGMTALGVTLGAAALAAMIVYLISRRGVAELMPFGHPTIGPFFYLFATIALVTAVAVVVHPRPVYSALYFVMTVIAVAGVVLLAAAEFLAIAILIIYAGAILVTYLFVIMLAQQSRSEDLAGAAGYDASTRPAFAPLLLGFILLAALGGPIADQSNWPASHDSVVEAPSLPEAQAAAPPEQGNVASIGRELFTTHVLSVQLAGVLLLVGIVGAVAIARKRVGQEDMIEVADEEEGEVRDG
jgi:NADH-quinone oxidoreductase subunit J